MTHDFSEVKLTYGGYEIPLEDVPFGNVLAMIRRGITHYIGNEQAAKVTAKADAYVKKAAAEYAEANAGIAPDADTLEAIKADAEALRGDWAKEVRDAAYKTLMEGEVGAGARGPAVDPFEAECERLAKARIKARFDAQSPRIKMPKEGEKVQLANGEFTLDELIERQLSHPEWGEAIRAEAEATLAKRREEAAARAAAKAKLAVAGPKTVDALGL